MPEEIDLDAFLALPREEQDRLMAAAAEDASPLYAADLALPPAKRELTAFTALDGEPFHDDPPESSANMSNIAYYKAFVPGPDYPSHHLEIATFTFSFAELIPMLNALNRQSETETGRGVENIAELLAFLETHSSPNSAPVILTYVNPKRYFDPVLDSCKVWPSLIAKLLTRAIPCEVRCNECDILYDNPELSVEEWSYDHGPLASGAERNWLCPQGHVVFRYRHFIS